MCFGSSSEGREIWFIMVQEISIGVLTLLCRSIGFFWNSRLKLWPFHFRNLCENLVLQGQILICLVKFTFTEKATKIKKIFTVNLIVCRNHQIGGEDFVHFCSLVRKHELYEWQNFCFKILLDFTRKGRYWVQGHSFKVSK